MKATLDNQTDHPTRTMSKVVRWTLDQLDVDIPVLLVRVKTNRSYTHGGAFYQGVHGHKRVWDSRKGSYRSVSLSVPEGIKHLITARIPAIPHPGVHDRGMQGGPPPIAPKDWIESVVCIVAHEATHLRQYLFSAGKGGEVECEWAEYRLLKRWRERKV